MRTMRKRTLAIAFGSAIGTLSSLAAQAALVVTTDSLAFGGSNSVSDTEGGTSTQSPAAALGSSSLDQFDANLGVLTGTTLNLQSTRTQTITVTGVGSVTSKSKATASGSGSSSARIEAAGVDSAFLPVISHGGSCSGKASAGCSTTTSSGPTATNAALSAAGALDAYVGNGTVLVTRTAPTLTAEHGADGFPGTGSTTYGVTWEGKLSATYEYLLHAAPSFDENAPQGILDLDFGYFEVGEAASPLTFGIWNLTDADRIALDLLGIALIGGDGGVLATDLSPFSGLAAGDGLSFSAYFDTNAAGSTFSASYLLTFADAQLGAASSRFSYSMVLNLSGTLGEAQNGPAPVPEPSLLVLLGIGLAGLAAAGRRPRRCRTRP